MNVQELRKNSQYKVCQSFRDFYHNAFAQGEVLTFLEFYFLPYHGGYTIRFKEKILYLQEEENANILDSLGEYLQPEGSGSPFR